MSLNFQQLSQPVRVTIALLKTLQVQVTSTTVNETLQNHPDYPSLLSISDSLKKWHIDNVAWEVRAEQLHDLQVPFIAVLGTGSFVLVTNVSEHVTYQTGIDGKKRIIKEKDEFLARWEGIVLTANATSQSGETNFKQKRRSELVGSAKIPILLFLSVLVSVFGVQKNNWDIAYSIFLLLKLTGVIITVLLLWYEIDRSNPFLKQICTATKKTDCSAILNSKKARIFGMVSWSEIGFFYFCGGFIFLLLSAASRPSSLSLISWLNLISLPYTVFSVYYQWRVARQWCVLCLAVQFLLGAEFISSMYFNTLTGNLQYASYDLSIISYLLPASLWILLRPILHQNQEARREKRDLARLKYDTRIFNALLEKQKRIGVSPSGLGITIGNPSASNTIIKICNPYCGPCAKAHPEIDTLIENNKEIKVQILFTATNNENDIKALPVKHLLAIDSNGDKTITKRSLDDWYLPKEKDYKMFAAKYPINGELQEQNGKVQAMNNWCEKIGIDFTPTFFVNGFQLPDIYNIKDLSYFLAE